MAGRIEEYSEDYILIHEGQMNNKMYLILEGTVAMYVNYKQENEYLLGVRGKGKIIGEISMLAESENLFTAVAFSNVKVAWFQVNNISVFLNEYPDYALDFMKNMAKNNFTLRKSFNLLLEELEETSAELVNLKLREKEMLKLGAGGDAHKAIELENNSKADTEVKPEEQTKAESKEQIEAKQEA